MRGAYMEAASMAAVGLCIGFWLRAKGYDQDERGNAERRALFVGLWPPMLWLVGQSICEIDRMEQPRHLGRLGRMDLGRLGRLSRLGRLGRTGVGRTGVGPMGRLGRMGKCG
ncbi:hypothetical protein [Streptomyces sp. NBC_01180]|uniref:hypothetical protein n=1 Tax=Streptomyces sp. NBC_01180 TaxID=2903763 RepID=UPI00386780E6|nr:hypothetical protein OG708_13075 [Streptomyces sp. NBC_01180]